ncbi:MAG: rod shape-determining protein MreC [Myxococcota bacterium]
MWRALERLRAPVIFALAILVPAALYRAQTRGPGQVNILDRLLLAASAPVQAALESTVGAASDAWHGYVDLTEARATEVQLRRRLAEERKARMALEVLDVENEHLRALLELKARNPSQDFVVARIIAAGYDPTVSVVRVDKGALQGLKRGDPVLGADGLVGRVLSVGWTTSDVQILADPRVSVPAQALRTGARGRLEGKGDRDRFGLVLSEVLRSDDLRAGDRIMTSGLGNTYPRGVPIGIVTRVFTRDGVPHRFADVAPFVDFARLEFVEVLRTAAPGVPLVTPEPLLPPALRAAPPDAGPRDVGVWPPPPPDAGVLSGDSGIAEEGSR